MRSSVGLTLLLASIFSAAPSLAADAPQVKSTPPLLDYCERRVTIDQVLNGTVVKILDEFGAEAWEMVSTVAESTKRDADGKETVQTYLLFFKRPARSGLKNCSDTNKAVNADL